MSFYDKLYDRMAERARKRGPRMGSVLIPESAVNFMPDPKGSPGSASDIARYAVAQGHIPGYRPVPMPAPQMPGQGSPVPMPAPVAPGQGSPVALPGGNPFAARARQMGFADFQGAPAKGRQLGSSSLQSAQATALRGGASHG